MKNLIVIAATLMVAYFVSPALKAQDGQGAADGAAKAFWGSSYKTDREMRAERVSAAIAKQEAAKAKQAAAKAAELYRKPLMDKLNATLDQVDASRIRIVIEADKSNSTEIEFEKVTDDDNVSSLKERK